MFSQNARCPTDFLDNKDERSLTWTPQTWMGDHQQTVQKIHDTVAKQLSPKELSVNKRLQELPLAIGDRVLVQHKTARQ